MADYSFFESLELSENEEFIRNMEDMDLMSGSHCFQSSRKGGK